MSGLRPVVGHDDVRSALAAALLRGALAPALLFTGPTGVGKQRVALWLAQLTLCDSPSADEPCGVCRNCRLANHLEHPDIHWFFPLPRPRVSGGPDRLGDALEDARATELESRRSGSWSSVPRDDLVGIYLAHAQVIRRVAGTRPAMARHKVIIIGDAEQLVPQEASPDAANALLKLFEEPPPDTTIIATAAEPDALLPTVRSRLLPVRFGRLSDRLVVDHLEGEGVTSETAVLIARLAEGSIGRAVGFVPADGGAGLGPLDTMRQRARAVLDAVFDGAGEAYMLPLSQPPFKARGDFATMLEFVLSWLRDLAAMNAGADDSVINVDGADWLNAHAHRFGDGRAIADAIGDVDEMLHLTEFNINPQLALRGVIHRLGLRLSHETAVAR